MSDVQQADLRFPCPPRNGLNLAATLICLVGTIVCAAQAISGQFQVRIGYFIRLSIAQSQIFLAVLSLVGLLMMIGFGAYFVLRVVAPQLIVLSDDGLYSPRSPWSTQNSFIAYVDVISAEEVRLNNQTVFRIIHKTGKQKIPFVSFDSQERFESFQIMFRDRLLRQRNSMRGVTGVAIN